MNHYTRKNFTLPEIKGISKKQIETHLKLYEGYVQHTNTIITKLAEWQKDTEKNNYLIAELRRRFAFEFDGMRNHEYYFSALTGGPHKLLEGSDLGKVLVAQFGSLEIWRNEFKHVASSRGSGWALLYFDPTVRQFITAWVDEHHLGHLTSLPIIVALDCWEHAYMVDHIPNERGIYIDAYLDALNWETVNRWFSEANKMA
jgi:Fe-Mn family superoxide dismutase